MYRHNLKQFEFAEFPLHFDEGGLSPDNKFIKFAKIIPFCGRGTDVCPEIEGKRQIYDKTGCIAWGLWADSCPHGAIRLAGMHVAVEDVVSIVNQNFLFYLNSGGG